MHAASLQATGKVKQNRSLRLLNFILMLNLIEITQLSYWPPLYGAGSAFGSLLNSAVSYVVFLVTISFLSINLSRTINAVKKAGPLLLIAFLLWAFVCSMVSADTFRAFTGALKLSTMLAFFAYVIQAGQENLHRVIVRFAFIFTLLNIVVIFVLPSHGTETINSIRLGAWRGLLPFKTQLGVTSAILFLYMFASLLHRLTPRTLKTYMLTALLLILIVGSQSRMAWLGSLAGVVAIYTSLHFKRMPQLYKLGSIILVVGLTTLLSYWFYIAIVALVESTGRDLTFTGRTNIWIYFIDLARENPVFGSGMGVVFQDDLVLERARFVIGWEEFSSAHNSYIEWMLATGWMGLIGLVVITFHALSLSLKAAYSKNSGYTQVLLGPVIMSIIASCMTSMAAASGVIWMCIILVFLSSANETTSKDH